MKYSIKLIVFITLVAGVAGCAQEAEEKLPFNYDEANFTQALQSGTPVVLEIGASWCKQCIEQQPIMEELKREYTQVKFFLADFDTERELVSRYGVRGIPYFVFFDAGGEKVFEITGFQEKGVMEMLVKRVLYGRFVQNGTYTTHSSFEEPTVALEEGRVVMEARVRENVSLWGESAEVLINNMTLRIVNITPPIDGIKDFELLNVTAGEVVRVVAELPSNLTAYDTINVELKLGIYDEACCGNYREVLLGGSFAEFDKT